MRRIRAVIVGMLVVLLGVFILHSAPAADQEPQRIQIRSTSLPTPSGGDSIIQAQTERITAEQEAARLAAEQEAQRAALEAQQEVQRQEAARKAAASAPEVRVAPPGPSGDVWSALRQCESGGNYQSNTGNGYYGAYQFSAGTWRSMNTGYDFAHLAPPEVQDDAAQRLVARSGFRSQFPACSKKLGLE